MPIIRGAASEVTTLAKANATQTTDPTKKSRTFVAPNKAVIAPMVLLSSVNSVPLSQTVTFAFTGDSQRFTVPSQVTSVLVTLIGAGGASHGGGSYVNGGAGGYVSGRLGVRPGEALDIVVGGGGVGVVGGYGGGGLGNDETGGNTPGGGGGRTAIRRSGEDIVTAGGGGGAGRGVSGRSGIGGAGGGPIGQDSQRATGFEGDSAVSLGKGGTQFAGGAGGAVGGGPGSKYKGGSGGTGDDTGGGGGGWYGGGGGGETVGETWGGGGGGGSSYVALLDATYPIVDTQGGGAAGGTGVNTDPQRPGGNGSCVIQFTVIPGYHDWKSPPFNGRIYIT